MGQWLPHNVSTYGGEIDSLFILIYYLTGIVFLLVAAVMVAFLWKYRDRQDGRRATYSHGNNTLEIIWTVIPAIIFIALGVMASKSWADIKIHRPPADLVVRVTGKQFNWEVQYPGPDGKLDTPDDYGVGASAAATENLLRVPVNKVVHVELRSKDVIHSFFVPQFRLKQDALPGRTILAWFEATEPGKYELPCAELCGSGHTTMRGHVKVLDEAAIAKDAMDAKAVLRGWPSALVPASARPAPSPTPAAMPEATPAEAPSASPSPTAH